MTKTIPIPEGFAVDIPDYNLVFMVSPFPTLKPIVVTSQPYDVESHLVWVKVDTRQYGLFERKQLNTRRCPTCGGEWKHEGDE